MKKGIILFSVVGFIFLFGNPVVQAQEVRVIEDPAVSRIMDRWAMENNSSKVISGWRVQLLASTDRSRVEREKTAFLTRFPDVPADWIHERPYYKLRVGAFHTRLEAQSFISYIKEYFTGAYPARDTEIPPADFLRMRQ